MEDERKTDGLRVRKTQEKSTRRIIPKNIMQAFT